jgi:hypothetical protein
MTEKSEPVAGEASADGGAARRARRVETGAGPGPQRQGNAGERQELLRSIVEAAKKDPALALAVLRQMDPELFEETMCEAAPVLSRIVLRAAKKDPHFALEVLELLGGGRRTTVEMPGLPPTPTLADVRTAQAHVLEKVFAGELPLEDGQRLFDLLARYRETVEATDLAVETRR